VKETLMSLISEFAKVATRLPQKIALITGQSQLTYRDILAMVQVLDDRLNARGIRPGQTVALASPRAEFCIALALLASYRGWTAVFSGISPQPLTEAGLAYDWLLLTEPQAQGPEDRTIRIEPDWFRTPAAPALPDFAAHQGAGARFAFASSGTTGVAKFPLSSEENRLEAIADSWTFLGEGLSGRRGLSSLTAGSGWAFTSNFALLFAGGSVVSLGIEASQILPMLDLHHIDTLLLTPAIVSQILALPDAAQFLGSVRDVRFGGSLIAERMLVDFARICPARLFSGYGAAEIGTCFISRWQPDDARAAGYVGRLSNPRIEVAFFDDALNPAPGATEGIIGFRSLGKTGARSYLTDPHDAKTGFHHGFFIPGDIMRREGDDFFLIGRTKNILNISGNKFSLEMIGEHLARAFPGADLVPLVDTGSDGLERLALAYRADHALSAAEVQRALDATRRFPVLEVTRVIRIDAFPVTQTAKIDIKALRRQIGLDRA
jgi:acyl-CoA synthetase (AMP-forming)/AMP-acid ligase II